ncbi:Nucleolar complex protein 3-like protein, partial [Smittium mucronatum]
AKKRKGLHKSAHFKRALQNGCKKGGKNKKSAPPKKDVKAGPIQQTRKSLPKPATKRKRTHHELVEQDDIESDDIDASFIKDNAASLVFLKNIDPLKLTEKMVKPVSTKPKSKQKPTQQPQNLSDDDNSHLEKYIKNSIDYESKSDSKKLQKDSKNYDIEHVHDLDVVEPFSDIEYDSHSDQNSASDNENTFFSDHDSDLSFQSDNDDETSPQSDNDSETSLHSDNDSDNSPQNKDYNYLNRKEKKKIKRSKEVSDLMDYELDSREFNQDTTESHLNSSLLPIKDRSGKIVYPSLHSANSAHSSDSQDSDSHSSQTLSDSEPEPDTSHKSLTAFKKPNLQEFSFSEKPTVPLDEYFLLCQMQIASISESIIQNPEENIVNFKSLLKYLSTNFHNSVDPNTQFKIKQLALVSSVAIFCDIIPGYRIRDLTKQELETKVSKDVKLLRKFEESLVKYYRSFLYLLFGIVDDVLSTSAKLDHADTTLFMSDGVLAVKALVQLLNTHTHFNFRTDIIEKLVSVYIQTPENTLKTAAMANEARNGIITLLKQDITGRYSDEAALLASKQIKKLSYRVDPTALRPWLFMPLCDELVKNPDDLKQEESQQARKEAIKRHLKLQKRLRQGRNVGSQDVKRSVHISKKQRKYQKELKETQKDLDIAEAEVDLDERKAFQASTLKHIFITYFRILKHKQSPGLFAHLISVDFFPDLLASLKRIVNGQEQGKNPNSKNNLNDIDDGTDLLISTNTSPRSILLCVITAVHMLTAQKDFASLDLVEFFNYLYSLIPILACRLEIEDSQVHSENSLLDNSSCSPSGDSNGDNSAEFGAWEASVKTESTLFIDCLHMLFLKKIHKVPFPRVCAFAKRISIACCYFPTKTAVKCLKFLELLLIKYPDMANLFKSSNTVGGGIYLPYIDESDMSNANSTCLYEMHKLLLHHNSQVRSHVSSILKTASKIEEDD